MRTIVIIPARYASTRFPGKPLTKLSIGAGRYKSLIQLSWESASKIKNVKEIFIATDDKRIQVEAETFGAKVIMTSEDCMNGTERCAEAMDSINFDGDLVVNFQGDAPLTPSWFVEDLIQVFKEDVNAQIATPVLKLDTTALRAFRLDRSNGRVGGTTVVFDADWNALYFSKEIIPYLDEKRFKGGEASSIFHHVGVYAYRPNILLNYKKWKASNLELAEGLEQLRFLENKCSVKCVLVDGKGRAFWELNNPEDVPRIEQVINASMSKKGKKNKNN